MTSLTTFFRGPAPKVAIIDLAGDGETLRAPQSYTVVNNCRAAVVAMMQVLSLLARPEPRAWCKRGRKLRVRRGRLSIILPDNDVVFIRKDNHNNIIILSSCTSKGASCGPFRCSLVRGTIILDLIYIKMLLRLIIF